MIIKVIYIKSKHVEDFTDYCNYRGIKIESNKKSVRRFLPRHVLKISYELEKLAEIQSILKMINN